MTVIPIIVLALGTFAFRFGGTMLRERLAIPDHVRELLETGAIVLLAALVATSTLFKGQSFVGWALPAGVLVGGLLAWRKLPFIVVIVAGAVTTALLRVVGVS